jgi:preprotein translocase subunit SecE
MFKKLHLYKFFDQVKQEAKKITWPEKKEVTTSVVIVVMVVLVFSLSIMILDYLVHSLIVFLLNIGN